MSAPPAVSPRWYVDEVPPREEGLTERGHPRRYVGFWHALTGSSGEECGHHHPSPYLAHLCGGRLWGAENEERRPGW